MKVFAIITASLMAVAGGVYFYSTESGCPGSKCSLPVAKTGGCCSQSTGEVSTEVPSCCAKLEDCCLTNAACCTTASVAKVNKSDCCFPGAACCEAGLPCCVTAACCTVTSMTAVAKPKEIAGCCDEGVCVTTTVKNAAKSIAITK